MCMKVCFCHFISTKFLTVYTTNQLAKLASCTHAVTAVLIAIGTFITSISGGIGLIPLMKCCAACICVFFTVL